MSEFLNLWFSDVPAGAYAYSSQMPGGRFTNGAASDLSGLAEAIAGFEAAGAQGIWFRCTTLAEMPMSGRGTAEDTLAVPGVWADIDITGPGHKNSGLPATEDEALGIIERSGMPKPTAILHTGGGLSAWWKYDEALCDLELAANVSKHVHELLKAGSPGVRIDNVSDLARVMRAPETTNRKPGVDAPCEVFECDGALYRPELLLGITLQVVRRAAESAVADTLFDSSPQRHSEERRFTLVEAKLFARPALVALAAAQDGEINVALNAAAKRLSHFGPDFWTRQEADGWLNHALGQTAYDGQTWLAADTIESAFKSAASDWSAVRIKEVKPSPDVQPDFTDASLAEYVASEIFVGKFIRTKGLGWLRWTGQIWRACDEGSPIEATRRFVKKKLIDAIKRDGVGSTDAKGWAKYNGAGKIASVVSLAGNMEGVLREATDFDQHPDLLNTPEGVLNLKTLVVVPHDQSLLLTKITKGSFRQGFTTADFQSALEAVPEDARTWLQGHFGAGVTGRPKPRVPAVLLTGEGRNGKTMLCETALEALGGIDGEGYAVQVPNELLLLGKVAGGPSPEKMALRGARFAYVEETPDGRYLDVQALKKVIGTGVIAAREMYKSLVTFRMTHVMFINSNFPPRVSETDTATWDRLTALRFPFRYRKENDEAELGPWKETDRRGSATLAEDLLQTKNLDAMLTWMVEGYQFGRTDELIVPESVSVSVREWRKEGDLILRFFDEVLEFDSVSWVTTGALYDALRKWCEAQGQKQPPPSNTFFSRLKGHTAIGDRISVRTVLSTRPSLSLPASSGWLAEGKNASRPSTYQTHGCLGVRFVSGGYAGP